MKRNILFRAILPLVIVLSLLACSRQHSLRPLHSARVVPYQLELEFSSALKELYYVFSGPAFTYGRFPVNARLSALLRHQAQQQSSPNASRQVLLKVHVVQLKTEFDEIGQNRLAEPVLVAMAGSTVWSLLISDRDREGDFSLPERTSKTARMALLLRLERSGQLLGEKKLEVEHTESHYWYNDSPVFIDYHRYNYEPVLDELYRKVLAEVGSFVEQTLGV